MIRTARREAAAGREGEAGLRRAVAEAPGHPLVKGEIARRRLAAGATAEALNLLREAVAQAPDEASLWLDLAAAERALGRPGEEMAALEKVLVIEPRNLGALLRAARLQAQSGDSRLSAATYRTALQAIPAGARLSPEMSAEVQMARSAIEANNVALESFLEDRFRTRRAHYTGDSLKRFDRALQTVLLKRRVYRPQPSFLYFPQLPALEFFDRADFPWLDALEAGADDMRAELLALLDVHAESLEPYMSLPGTVTDKWRELNRSRRWGVFFLWHEGVAFPETLRRCPRTVAALADWPRCDIPGCSPTAMFSILDARTRIPPHTGVNNCRLVVHLPLIVPPGCGFRVGAETRVWEEGKAFVFDDTIEHEAWNDSPRRRAVLILDVWNPFLSEAERDMVRLLCSGVDAFYGDLPQYIRPAQRTG